jgi:hypothetical protein
MIIENKKIKNLKNLNNISLSIDSANISNSLNLSILNH